MPLSYIAPVCPYCLLTADVPYHVLNVPRVTYAHTVARTLALASALRHSCTYPLPLSRNLIVSLKLLSVLPAFYS